MSSPSQGEKALLAKPDIQKYNFQHEYSIVLDHPISEVYPILAHGAKMEHVVRLSSLCVNFELLYADVVVPPDSAPLAISRVRTEPAFISSTLAFGLTHKKVAIVGAQTWDEDAKVALYESVTDQGIVVWKLRAFKEIEEDGRKKTRVVETIKGSCPVWLKLIVQKETAKSNKVHMQKYRTLFDV